MEKKDYLVGAYNALRMRGVVRTQKDFAALVGSDPSSISKAMKGDESYLNEKLIKKVENLLSTQKGEMPIDWVKDFPVLDLVPDKYETLPVIPTEAMAGTLGEFTSSVEAYDCERIVSPVNGADYAMKVCGDSMSPEYPSGCMILIKKINEKAFVEWGKVYVLDTENGAVIKQIRRTDDDGVVECVSLNPSYQPFTIDTKYIFGWYRVLMVLSLK